MFWFCLYLLSGPASINASDLSTAFESFGVTRVQPPIEAPDFQLQDLHGETHTLSNQHGRWVVLTFWATWCAPCRSEMPGLQTLFQRLDPSKATVLAVAIGSEKGQVSDFVAAHNLTFPVVIDVGDRIAALYKATGVPISFLIDPSGKVVGIVRGARDWTQAYGLMQTLTTGAMPENQKTNNDAKQSDGSLDLPKQLIPPSADVKAMAKDIQPGGIFTLEIKIHWAGHLRDYLLLPPKVQLPEGIAQQSVEASSSSQSGTQWVTYKIHLQAEKEGTFSLDPIEIRYTPHTEGKPLAERIQGPTVVIQAGRFFTPTRIFAFAGIGGLLLLSGLVGIWYAKKRRRVDQTAKLPDHVHWNLSLQELRSLRVSGDLAGFLALASELIHALGQEEARENQNLSKLIDLVRYGNHIPEDREIDRLERQLELWIKDKLGNKNLLVEEGIRLLDR